MDGLGAVWGSEYQLEGHRHPLSPDGGEPPQSLAWLGRKWAPVLHADYHITGMPMLWQSRRPPPSRFLCSFAGKRLTGGPTERSLRRLRLPVPAKGSRRRIRGQPMEDPPTDAS